MAKEIRTEILVQATTEKIWSVLTDFEKYPEWNPFIVSLTGTVKPGNMIRVVLQAPGKKAMTFTPRILSFEKNTEFRWRGKLLFPGIFDGEHIFELHDNRNGTVTFIQREKFRGILVPLLRKMLEKNTRQGFEMMNAALKKRVESR